MADLLPILLLLMPSGALAHKLKVFAFVSGDRIEGSAYFAGGAKATGASILIQDVEGNPLATLTPTQDGRFSYRVLQPIDHRVIARTGDGHQAEWRISASELEAGVQAATLSTPALSDRRGDADGPSEIETTAPAAPAALGRLAGDSVSGALFPASGTEPDPRWLAAIEQAVEHQVRPLREQLILLEDRVRFQDILGGFGYILGLTGIALWWRCRKSSRET